MKTDSEAGLWFRIRNPFVGSFTRRNAQCIWERWYHCRGNPLKWIEAWLFEWVNGFRFFLFNLLTIEVTSAEQFNTAVSVLRQEISTDSAKIVRFSIEGKQSHGIFLQQFGFGVAIRNLLAKNGILWEEAAIYSVWLAILKESIKAVLHE